MVSPLEPAVEVPPQPGMQEPETESPDRESPEMIRARELIEKINALEAATRRPRSISGKRASEKLADARRLLESRIDSIPDFERHSRKCQVCHSRWVEEIEEAYFNWSSAQWIINSFNISYDDAVYRHARAIGLDIKRRKNVVIAVEKLIEKVDEVTVTSSTIIRAVRALSCLDATGRWSDLPTTHIVMSSKDLPAAAGPSADMNTTGVPRSAVAITSAEVAAQRTEVSAEAAAPSTEDSVSESATSTACPEPARRGGRSRRDRSEPPRASDRTIPAAGPFSKIKPQASSLEHPEPNRGTYEKLEIAANCRKQSAKVNSNRGNFRD